MIFPPYKLVLYSKPSGYVAVSAKWPEMDNNLHSGTIVDFNDFLPHLPSLETREA